LDPRTQAERLATDTIELELPERLMVAARITEATPYLLTTRGTQSFLEGASDTPAVPVVWGKPPRFYDRTTSRGTPMGAIASVRRRHLLVAPGGPCGFAARGTPCPFCLEGARATAARAGRIDASEVVEVVHAALAERRVDAIYLNSCAFDADDGGIVFLTP